MRKWSRHTDNTSIYVTNPVWRSSNSINQSLRTTCTCYYYFLRHVALLFVFYNVTCAINVLQSWVTQSDVITQVSRLGLNKRAERCKLLLRTMFSIQATRNYIFWVSLYPRQNELVLARNNIVRQNSSYRNDNKQLSTYNFVENTDIAWKRMKI